MKILKILLAAVFVVLIGGFGAVAFMDIPVHQQEVSKEIPNDRFFAN